MYTSTILSAIFLAVGANAIALPRQADACFIIGNSVLPQEVIDTVDSIKGIPPLPSSSVKLRGL
jgi:hypothetical protein